MGEAKRRRILDPNYGQPQVPKQLAGVWSEFLSKQKDLVIADTRFLYPETYTTKNQFFTIPRSANNNSERKLFTESQQQIMDALTPLILEHGKGWIYQLYDYEQDYPEWIYVLATTNQLHDLQTLIFTGPVGKLIASVINCALKEWSFSEHKILIPVVAMSTDDDYPSWLFCI